MTVHSLQPAKASCEATALAIFFLKNACLTLIWASVCTGSCKAAWAMLSCAPSALPQQSGRDVDMCHPNSFAFLAKLAAGQRGFQKAWHMWHASFETD